MIKLKVVLLGSMGVGKTTLCNMLVTKEFNTTYQVTVGVGYFEFGMDLNGHKIELQIWDTAGMERHSNLGSIYYRGASAVVMVYDLTDPKTIEVLDFWLDTFLNHNTSSCYGIVVGNKCDLATDNMVRHRGMVWAEKHGFDHVITTSKDFENVFDLFNHISIQIMKNSPAYSGIEIETQKKRCC